MAKRTLSQTPRAKYERKRRAKLKRMAIKETGGTAETRKRKKPCANLPPQPAPALNPKIPVSDGKEAGAHSDVVEVSKPGPAFQEIETTHRGSCWATREQVTGNIKMLQKYLLSNGCPVGDPDYEIERVQQPGSMEYEFKWFRKSGGGPIGNTDNGSIAEGGDSFALKTVD